MRAGRRPHLSRSTPWRGATRAAAVAFAVTLTLGCEPPTTGRDAQEPSAGPAAGATPVASTASAGAARLVLLESATPQQLGAYGGRNLPAYRTAAELALPGAQDAADDYRNANPHYFAATVPPAVGKYRPFGEWETMGEVWTTYSSGMSGEFAVRRMFAEQTIAFLRDSQPPIDAYVIVNTSSLASDFDKAVTSNGITAAEKARITYVTLPNQTIWHIDYGPFPLVDVANGALAFVDWNYYKPRHLDDALGVRVPHEIYGATVYRVGFPFEGGNIQADGASRCATTTRALANTGFSQAKVRHLLERYAACKTTYILEDITDDGTGHLDMFFKWTAAGSVLIGEYTDTITADVDGDGTQETVPNPSKVAPSYSATFAKNKQRMDNNAALFKGTLASDGKPYAVARLPMMTRFQDEYGDLPRTFINSTLTNGVNVYPSYATASCQVATGGKCKVDADCSSSQHCAAGRCTPGAAAQGCDELVACPSGQVCKADGLKVALAAQVQQKWQAAMPTWKHVGLRADTIALWSGAIHCITRTVPKTTKVEKAFADGACIAGACGCVPGGSQGVCDADAECFGPAWLCNCMLCKGSCASGKACTDDADCVADGSKPPPGACTFDKGQGCYGLPPLVAGGGGSGGGDPSCGGVSFEGKCEGKQLSYCDGGLKGQACTGCCGWDAQNGYYNCLSGNACAAGCVAECSAGSKGCSVQGSHAWSCDTSNGCGKRVWTECAGGCDAGSGTCKGGSSGGVCPSAPDAGGGDADVADAGDSAAEDAATPDVATADAVDAGSPDAAETIAGDAATSDAAITDAGASDAGATDAATTDGAETDAGPADAGDSGIIDGSLVDGADGGTTWPLEDGSQGTDAATDTGGACLPACVGKVCGDDGCGGSCGPCAAGVCGPAGFCIGADADTGEADAGAADAGGARRGDGVGSNGDGLGLADGVTTTYPGYYGGSSGGGGLCQGAPRTSPASPAALGLLAGAMALLAARRRSRRRAAA